MFYVVGLGNPGNEYEKSRHNAGRMAVLNFAKKFDFPDFRFDKKSNSQISKSKIGKEDVLLVLPDTFMNNSGKAISYFVKPKNSKKKEINNLLVVYDDIDLALGTVKISFNKGSGGHRGLESIVKTLKTKEFSRLRIGLSFSTASGKIKKPGMNMTPKAGEKAVLDFILGDFKNSEIEILKKVFKKTNEAIKTLISEGRDRAMNIFN